MSQPKQAFHALHYYSIVLCRVVWSPEVVAGSASLMLPGNMLGIHILRIQPRPTESVILKVVPRKL